MRDNVIIHPRVLEQIESIVQRSDDDAHFTSNVRELVNLNAEWHGEQTWPCLVGGIGLSPVRCCICRKWTMNGEILAWWRKNDGVIRYACRSHFPPDDPAAA